MVYLSGSCLQVVKPLGQCAGDSVPSFFRLGRPVSVWSGPSPERSQSESPEPLLREGAEFWGHQERFAKMPWVVDRARGRSLRPLLTPLLRGLGSLATPFQGMLGHSFLSLSLNSLAPISTSHCAKVISFHLTKLVFIYIV